MCTPHPVLSAAIHEAAHAVLAAKSQYHRLRGTVYIDIVGRGLIFFELCMHKLRSKRKDISTVAEDEDVAREHAVILSAGYIAEIKICAENLWTEPDFSLSITDRRMAIERLRVAGLSPETITECISVAERLVARHWSLISMIAQNIVSRNGVMRAFEITLIVGSQ